jgi:hypothetical protein
LIYAQTYIGKEGVILLDECKFVGAFGEMKVPRDTWKRAARLQLRFGRDRHEYIDAWCGRKMLAEYEQARKVSNG